MARLPLRVLDGCMEFLCALFGYALGAIAALMCLDILLRNLGLGSLPWLIELTEYLMYGGTFLAAPWVLRQGSHVRVDLLLVAIPSRHAVRLEQFVDAVGLTISAVMAIYGTGAVANAYATVMLQFKTWTVPEWILLLPIPVGCTLLAVEFLLRIFRVPGIVSDEYKIANRPSL